jgi:uncharacterized protein (DUF1778 family)
VRARVAKRPRHVFSLRVSAKELDHIGDAAELKGVSVGDFIRNAALKAADAELEPSSNVDLEAKVDEILRRLPPTRKAKQAS